jgi:hypothetical protein
LAITRRFGMTLTLCLTGKIRIIRQYWSDALICQSRLTQSDLTQSDLTRQSDLTQTGQRRVCLYTSERFMILLALTLMAICLTQTQTALTALSDLLLSIMTCQGL